jgi:hypothetical protein
LAKKVLQADSAEHYLFLLCVAEVDFGLLLLSNALVLLEAGALIYPRGSELLALFVD